MRNHKVSYYDRKSEVIMNVSPTLISSLPNVSFYRDLQPTTAIATLFVSQHDRLFASFFARMCIDPVTS